MKTVDVVYHDANHLIGVEHFVPAGATIAQHRHHYDHFSLLASGTVEFQAQGGPVQRLTGPCLMTVKAHTHHAVRAVTDVVWYCIHSSLSSTPKSDWQQSIRDPIEPPDNEAMRALAHREKNVSHIHLVCKGLNVLPVLWQLKEHPELWNQCTGRTEQPDSPHFGVHDIWLRYAPAGVSGGVPHESVWYPSSDVLTLAVSLVAHVMKIVDADHLGGIFITKILPGQEVKPHIDYGWHARTYDKYAIQLQSHPAQAFCFEGEEFVSRPGDVYFFDNAHSHWVTNPTDEPRITLIAAMRKGD